MMADFNPARAGRQLLAALEAGAPMRKKWVTRLTPAEAASAPRTTRHIRCRVDGGRVTLRYHHQARGPEQTLLGWAGACATC